MQHLHTMSNQNPNHSEADLDHIFKNMSNTNNDSDGRLDAFKVNAAQVGGTVDSWDGSNKKINVKNQQESTINQKYEIEYVVSNKKSFMDADFELD